MSRFHAFVPVVAALLASIGTVAPVARAQTPQPGMVEFFSFGKVRQGIPLLSTPRETVVLARDGWIHAVDSINGKPSVRPTGKTYRPISTVELRNELRAEYGGRFEVLTTKNFLVVQPVGRGDQWPRLFEQSHQGFVAYMSRRKVTVRKSNFPMVAVVMPDEPAMYAEMERLGVSAQRVAGVYTGRSNRVVTHDDVSRGAARATVRHEAVHQSAYNTGVHSRVGDTPKWISEGVGQMFEPAGMTNARTGSSLADRVNQDSLRVIQKRFKDRGHYASAVMSLIRDDAMFSDLKRRGDAYAVAWSMMFYLAERQPDRFAELLNHTSNRSPFTDYSAAQRKRDFQRIVGDPLDFTNRLTRYMTTL